jgi:hypothetical protein
MRHEFALCAAKLDVNLFGFSSPSMWKLFPGSRVHCKTHSVRYHNTHVKGIFKRQIVRMDTG